MPASLIAGAALAGLLGAPHCAAMCGGFAAICARRPAGALWWSAGRILTYAALGAIAGSIGARIPGPRWLPALVAALMLVWFSIAIAGFHVGAGWTPRVVTRTATRLAHRDGAMSRVMFGMSTGLLPCGMVYAALGLAVAGGSAGAGGAIMSAFGIGTLPALALFGSALRRLVGESLWRRRVMGLLVLVTGLWSIGIRLGARAGQGAAHAGHFQPPAGIR